MKDDSDSEEEILVYAEFEDSVNIDKYRAIHILGADEKSPIIQLDETFFMGKYENALGTYMFFEQDPTIQGNDPLFDKYPDKGVKYVCKTRKLVNMEHAYVTPKEGKELNPQSHENAKHTEDDVQPVMFQDLPEAMEAFRPYFKSELTSTESTNQENSYEVTIETAKRQNPDNFMIEIEIANVPNPENTITEPINKQVFDNNRVESIYKPNSANITTESTNKHNPEDNRSGSTDDQNAHGSR